MKLSKLRPDVANLIREGEKTAPIYIKKFCGARGMTQNEFQSAMGSNDLKIMLDFMRFSEIVDIESNPFPLDAKQERIALTNSSVEWITTKDSDMDRVMLYLHGGAYVLGSIDSDWKIGYKIAQSAKIRVLNVGYRLAPEHPYPAGLNDALEAYQWLLDQNILPQNIIICGSSAGGGLALALLQKIRETGLAFPRAAVLLSPWLDLTFSTESVTVNKDYDTLKIEQLKLAADIYSGSYSLQLPTMSPMFADFIGFPEIYFDYAKKELLADEIQLTIEKAKKAGVKVINKSWPDMTHTFQSSYDCLPEAEQSMHEITTYIQKVMNL